MSFERSDSPLSYEVWYLALFLEVAMWQSKMLRSLDWPQLYSGKNRKENNSTGGEWKQGVLEPFFMPLGCFSELGRLPYLIWERKVWAICWSKNLDYCPTDRYFLNIFLSRAGVYQMSSTFWAVTHPLPRTERTSIPHLKEDSLGFPMTPNALIFFGEITLFSAQSTSKPEAPRRIWITF